MYLRKDDVDPEELRPLPCRTWACHYCGPRRRRELMAEAAAGEPNKLLTLTVNANVGTSSGERRDLLHDAWKKLVKRINRQFALPPNKRWTLKRKTRTIPQQQKVEAITNKTAAAEVRAVPYFAFLERTKRGEPHLHILLRVPFIPQDWLSEAMDDLAGSPVVWIEEIKGAKHAVAYVTKYVTKEPAQWGNKKRYWRSRNWRVNEGDASAWADRPRPRVTLIREAWRTLLQRRVTEHWTWSETEEGWFRFAKPGTKDGVGLTPYTGTGPPHQPSPLRG